MIREFKKQDLDRIMELWLQTNISTHDFIAEEYWKSNYDLVRSMMPSASIYVYEEDGMVQGFIGLMDTYIAGFFVCQKFQSKGIGKKLLGYAKDKNAVLSLHVYKENDRAVHFYLREGFTIFNEQIDENTGKIELQMRWEKTNEKITLCGDNCLECPRYLAKSEDELNYVAQLWYQIGWRDKVVSNDEIRCTGCSSHKKCTYQLVECIQEKGIEKCNQCPEFPCQKIKSMLNRIDIDKEKCKEICSDIEFQMLCKAFFNKEENLKK